MYSKAKIAGHAIHPMLVSFPIAFYVAAFAAYVASTVTGDSFWYRVGVVANIAGVVGAAAAAIPGFIDWAFAIPNKHPAKMVGLEHMLFNVGALTLFTVDAAMQVGHWSDTSPSASFAAALAGIGVGFTLCAGFLGWRMVQKYHVSLAPTVDESTDITDAKTFASRVRDD